MLPDYTFKFSFNKGKQSTVVYLYDCDPRTFYKWAKTPYGFYVASSPRKPKSGTFGEIHLVWKYITNDMVAHELKHLWFDWIFANDYVISTRTEERHSIVFEEMTRNFWKEYSKAE